MPTGRKRAHSPSKNPQPGLEHHLTLIADSKDGHAHFGQIEHILKNCTNRSEEFTKNINTILTYAYNGDCKVKSMIAQFLAKNSEMRTSDSMSLQQIVSKLCNEVPAMTDAALSEFLSALPFLDDLHRLNMLSRKPFLSFAQHFMHHRGQLSRLALLCLYEIMRIVDKLIDDGLYFISVNEDNVWGSCLGRVVNARNLVDEEKTKEIKSFANFVKKKGGWGRKAGHGPENTKQAAQPAANSIPPLLKVQDSRLSSNAQQPPKSAVPNLPPATQILLNKLRRIVCLTKSNVNIDAIAREVYKSMEGFNEARFRDTIYCLLTLAFEASPLELPLHVQLLLSLQKLCKAKLPFVPMSRKEANVRVFVSSWAMRLRRFETMTDLLKFRTFLPLINALFKCRLVMSGIFKYYASEIANNEDETSMLALFEIISNVDKLADAKIWHYQRDEAAFYEECCCSLAMACQTNTIKLQAKVQEISLFLASIPQKGGWHRASIARFIRQSQLDQEKSKVTNENVLSDSEDESVILVAASFETPAAAEATDEGFEEKHNISNASGNIVPPMPTEHVEPANESIEADLIVEETSPSLEDLLSLLATSPENWPKIAGQLEAVLQASDKEGLINSADLLWNAIYLCGKDMFPVYIHIFDALQSVATGKFSLKKACTQLALKKAKLCKKAKHLTAFCLNLRIISELQRIGLLKRDIYMQYVMAMESKCEDEVLLSIMNYEVLRLLEGLADSKTWSCLEDEENEEYTFWLGKFRDLKKACKKLLSKHDRREEIASFLDNVHNRLFQKCSSEEKKVEKKTPSATHANFCGFVQTDFLSEQPGIMQAVKFFKSFLLSLQSTSLFVDAVETIFARTLEQLTGNRVILDAAAKLCSELSTFQSANGDSFIRTIQDTCVSRLFGAKNRSDDTNFLIKLHSQAESCYLTGEETNLSERYASAELAIRRKYIGCSQLIARLFVDGKVTFNYFLQLADCILSCKTDEMLEALLEMLTIAGHEFELQVRTNSMDMWLTKFFNEISHIGLQADASAKKRAVINEIVSLKTAQWPNVDEKQLASRQLKVMLLELTPALLRQPIKYNAAATRVRSFCQNCPDEYAKALIELMFTEFQCCLSDLSQTQGQLQQAQMQLMMPYQQYQPPSWPAMNVYQPPPLPPSNHAQMIESIPTPPNSLVKLQPGMDQSSSGPIIPRVISITSAAFPPYAPNLG